MPINSRNKGKAGELEISHIMQEYGFDVHRGQQHKGGADSPDVYGIPGIHAEIKRVERLNISEAMAQSIRDSEGIDIPAVFHRKNREKWMVTMRLDDWILLYKAYIADKGIS